MTELPFLYLYTSLLLNEISLLTKFLVDTSFSFRVMSRTICGLTDGRLDMRTMQTKTKYDALGYTNENFGQFGLTQGVIYKRF